VPASAVQVTTTVPTHELADRIARTLVEERLAACVQVQGPISSTYSWEGVVEQATEWYCHAKTTQPRLDLIVQRIRSLHPYATPEIIALPLIGGLPEYLGWIAEAVGEEA
jgi:periplasmic divalent cation tolerance protein